MRMCHQSTDMVKLIGMKGKELVSNDFNYMVVTKNIENAF